MVRTLTSKRAASSDAGRGRGERARNSSTMAYNRSVRFTGTQTLPPGAAVPTRHAHPAMAVAPTGADFSHELHEVHLIRPPDSTTDVALLAGSEPVVNEGHARAALG